MFTVVHDSPQTVWAPVINTDTLYVGQLVRSANEGVQPIAVANGVNDRVNKLTGAGDTGTANNAIFGVIVGTNKRTPTFNTTQKAESITYVAPASANTDDYFGVEGPWAKGDLQAMVEIVPITPSTVLRGKIFNGAYGTAPTETALSGTPTTVAGTSAAVDASGLAALATIYFRSGIATGAYRVTDDTSTTALTWDLPLATAPAAGDLVCRVNGLRPIGLSLAYIDSEGMYIDAGAALTSHYLMLDVLRLDLSVAGNEYVEFRFNTSTCLAMDLIA